MQIAMVGLGRMGAGLTRRLLSAGHQVVAYDVDQAAVNALAADGATPASSLRDLVDLLAAPRAVWVMVPAAYTDSTITELGTIMHAGDVIIDGGNSDWRDDITRAQQLTAHNIDYLDIGTSGGVWGEARGFCLMIGGPTNVVERLAPIFATLAPGVATATRSPSRSGALITAEDGWLHCGPTGAGHFVKMIHNGIEYGLMAAYAEGVAVLAAAGSGEIDQQHSAETAPLAHPEHFRYSFDLAAITELWRRGSVVPSWLLDLLANALAESPNLTEFAGRVSDSGEGRWTVEASIALGIPTPVLTAALQSRFASQGNGLFAAKAQSALRKQFGGHTELSPSEVGGVGQVDDAGASGGVGEAVTSEPQSSR